MSPISLRAISLAVCLLAAVPPANSALSESGAGQPVSFGRADLRPLEALALHGMPPVDVPRLLEEDAQPRTLPIPYRVGFAMDSDLSPSNSGSWEELPEGGRLWRLRVRSDGALWIVLGFGTFRPLPGATLFVHDEAGQVAHGPFTSSDVRDHGQLWIPPIAGTTAIVELFWPETLRGVEPNLHLGTVSHGYRALAELDGPLAADVPGGGGSGSCNIDVNCPLGDDWQDPKRGVARMLIGGSGLCTGSLINTTANDCRPYFLTAAHCLSSQGAAASTTFRFNYERPLCGSGAAPTNQNISGSTLLATYGPSDVTLLELDSAPPESYAPFHNGWNRSGVAATESWGIHHPGGDVKKICFNDDPLVDGQGSGWGSDHWRVTEWEFGTTEGGSSGSPMFDQNQRIVGQLHGGTASCSSNTWDEYGKVSVSWTGGGTPGTRLSGWLDPVGTGAVAIDGIDLAFCLTPRPELHYAGHVVQDLGGNGDSFVDPGEALAVQVDLANSGNLDALTVRGLLTTSTPGVAIADPAAEWPDIARNEQKTCSAPFFNLQIDPSFACGDPIVLELASTADSAQPGDPDTFEIQTGAPQVAEHLSDDFEGGVNGWTSDSLIGTASWVQATTDSTSPTHSWFIADTVGRRDTALVMPTIDALPTNSVLRFNQRYDTEAGKDGGVLEYSTNGGAAWLDAASLIVDGGYNGAIAAAESGLNGRPSWTGDSGGWRAVLADLSSLAGHDLDLRWRFATSFLVADVGWWVDDVVVDSTDFNCLPRNTLPGEISDPDDVGAPFTIDRVPGGFALAWSPPLYGGAALGYKLYRVPLGAGAAAPECEADLGIESATVVPSLTDDVGFLVVGTNSLGEGSYGKSGDGSERPSASGGAICP